MKLNPTHNVSINLLVAGTQAVINYSALVAQPGKTIPEISALVRSLFQVKRPEEFPEDKVFFVGMTTFSGTFEVNPERMTLLSVDVVDVHKTTEARAFMVFQEQVLVPSKAQQMAAQLPNIMMPGRN